MNTNTSTTTATTTIFQAARVMLKDFQDKYPVFRDCLPLAIGIDKQLIAQQPEIDRKTLRTALRLHTNSLRYLRVMTKASHRVDLEGNAAGEITELHRTHAATALQDRLDKDAEKRKLQRKAEEEQRKMEQEARQRTEKLNQLAAKFSRSA